MRRVVSVPVPALHSVHLHRCARLGVVADVSGWPFAEPQGEALGFTRDGRGYVTLSEGVHPPVHRFVAP